MSNHISVPPCDTCVISSSYSAFFPIGRVNCVVLERTDGVYFQSREARFQYSSL